jgi:hypothetical protein
MMRRQLLENKIWMTDNKGLTRCSRLKVLKQSKELTLKEERRRQKEERYSRIVVVTKNFS